MDKLNELSRGKFTVYNHPWTNTWTVWIVKPFEAIAYIAYLQSNILFKRNDKYISAGKLFVKFLDDLG